MNDPSPIDCETCRERLLAHRHGELELPQRRAMAEHLAHCGDCAREYCRLEALLVGVVEATSVAPGPERSRRMRDALRVEVRREFSPGPLRRCWRLISRPIPAYAALVAVCVPLALHVGSRSDAGLPVDDHRESTSPVDPIESPAVVREAAVEVVDYDAPGVMSPGRRLF